MSQAKSIKPILLGMQRHISNVQSDCACGEAIFLENRTIQDAVIYNLQNIGEYAKQLPEAVTTFGESLRGVEGACFFRGEGNQPLSIDR